MLWTLAVAMFLAGRGEAVTCSGKGMTQSGDNNYVIDTFTQTLEFPYAINQCTGVSLVDTTKSVWYTCKKDSDGMWWITKSSYTTSSDCTGSVDTTDWSESDYSEGENGYFKCDGKNNYASIQISTDTQCATYINLVGGLGGCASNPSAFDTKLYCSSSSALVELYTHASSSNQTMCDDDNLYCTQWMFGSECALGANFMGTKVYGMMTECSTDEDGNDDGSSGSNSSASSQFTVVGLVIALIVGLFH